MIFVSTGGERSATAPVTANRFIEVGIRHVELSGGKHLPALREELAALRDEAVFQVHNYFPPPAEPFVFNLASAREDIQQLSLDHAMTAINLAREVGRPCYSFHAGFLFDPAPRELGERMGSRRVLPRERGMAIFLANIERLARFADREGVELLIENNALSAANFEEFDCDPFLMTRPEEALAIMAQTPDNVGMLVDVGHLWISARTHGFPAEAMLRACGPWIKAYHLSENDGLSDLNEPVRRDSWFWPHLKRGLDYYSLEVYGLTPRELKAQADLAHELLTGDAHGG